MTSLTDCRYAAYTAITGTKGHINNEFLGWLQANGATSNNLVAAQLEFLTGQGVAKASLPEMWHAFYATMGATQSHRNDRAKYFWCDLGGSIGPTAIITLTQAGSCQYQLPATDCKADSILTGSGANLAGPIISYLWEIVTGNVTIAGPANQETVDITSTSGVHEPYTVRLTISDGTNNPVTTRNYIHVHTDITTLAFTGNISDMTFIVDTPFSQDVSGEWNIAADSYQLLGSWPPGFSIDNMGVITGTAIVEASYPNLSVRAIKSGDPNADSNTFTGTAQTEILPDFLAAAPDANGEMQMVVTGTGPGTATHTSTIYGKQANNFYFPIRQDLPVWEGGRIVRNRHRYTDRPDLWLTKINVSLVGGKPDPVGGNDAWEVTATATAARLDDNLTSVDVPITRASMWLRRVSGTGQVRINHGNATVKTDISGQLDGTWKRFATPAVVNGSTTRAGIEIVTSGDVVEMWGPQMEELATETDEPGEFVPNSAATYGAQKCFNYANGNTVASNIVTEAKGADYPEMPYLKYQPAATNIILHSRNYDDAAWSKSNTTVVADQVGIDGTSNTAWTVTDNSTAHGWLTQATGFATTGSGPVAKYWVGKDNDETRFVGIHIISGATNTVYHLNTKTGATTAALGPGDVTIEVIDDGNFWQVIVHTAVTVASNSRTYLEPADGTVFGTRDPLATGSCVVGQMEFHDNKTIAQVRNLGPIFTGASVGNTDAIVSSLPTINYQHLNMAMYAEFRFAHSNAEIPGIQTYPRVLYHGSNRGLELHWNNGEFEYNRDVPSRLAHTYNPFDVIKWGVVCYYDNNEVQQIINGVAGPKSNAATPPAAPAVFELFSLALITGGIRNMQQFHNISSFQEGKDIIDGLMT